MEVMGAENCILNLGQEGYPSGEDASKPCSGYSLGPQPCHIETPDDFLNFVRVG